MIEKMRTIVNEYEELQKSLSNPSIINDPEALRNIGRTIGKIEEVAILSKRYFVLENEAKDLEAMQDDPEMTMLVREEEKKIINEKEEIMRIVKDLLTFKNPNDEKDAIVEIRPAAGGDEAALFADDLVRMYLRFAEQKGFSVEIFSKNETEDGGIKEIIFAFRGNGAYGMLKHESGVHRIQRIPLTESKGRIHTSTATVVVLPETEEKDIEIRMEDVRVDVFRASGAGGQHVNKTESAVRLTHIPSGIVVACQDEKSQHKNKARAFTVLRSRLKAVEDETMQKEGSQKRLEQIGTGERSEKIRTYNIPQDRITDHRIKQNFSNIPSIFSGGILPLIEACQKGIVEDAEK
jgi:peptide chain release factor 1